MVMMMVMRFLLLAGLHKHASGFLDKNLGDLDTQQLVELLDGHVSELIDRHHERHVLLLVVTLDLLVIRLENLVLLVVLAVRCLYATILSNEVHISLDDFLFIHSSDLRVELSCALIED